jgi:UDP-N-acetylmuramoylalanine--D-glutamate ligase
MIELGAYEGERVGVLGLGLSGQATIAALSAGKAIVFAWDDKPESVEACKKLFPESKFSKPESWPWPKLKMLVVSPGIPLSFPKPHPVVMMAMAKGVRVCGDVELLFEATAGVKKLGITGTNGKSTTTALTYHLMKNGPEPVQMGGNIGTAALSLEHMQKGYYVLEMSSYQLDLLNSGTFNIAALLNITPDHIDRHGSMQGYIDAKKKIFDGQGKGDTAIISVDDEHCETIYEDMKRGLNQCNPLGGMPQIVPLSVEKEIEGGVVVREGILTDMRDGTVIDLTPCMALRGKHNWQNAAAAYVAARAAGCNVATIQSGMESFGGLEHRMQHVTTVNGVQFVNDSKGTNADATVHALRAYEDIYWILGGVAKDGGIESLAPEFHRITKAFLIGDAAESFHKVLQAKKVPSVICGTLNKAFETAARESLVRGKGVVLLSPACASFDQFKNFEARGRIFAKLATTLKEHYKDKPRKEEVLTG